MKSSRRLAQAAWAKSTRKRDTRLDRIIAIRVLPEHLASDPQFREWFDREARAISELDHPHICALHDVGHENSVDFLVMGIVHAT